jgi:hypothetical protein
MNWKIEIEGKRNQRILVVFDAKNETISFIGQYKPHNQPWEDFSVILSPMNIDLDVMKEKIFEAYKLLEKRSIVYQDLVNSFSLLKTIQVVDDVE